MLLIRCLSIVSDGYIGFGDLERRGDRFLTVDCLDDIDGDDADDGDFDGDPLPDGGSAQAFASRDGDDAVDSLDEAVVVDWATVVMEVAVGATVVNGVASCAAVVLEPIVFDPTGDLGREAGQDRACPVRCLQIAHAFLRGY